MSARKGHQLQKFLGILASTPAFAIFVWLSLPQNFVQQTANS